MSSTDVLRLMPFLVMGGTAIVIMLVISFYGHHELTLVLAVIGLAAALASVVWTIGGGSAQITSLIAMDAYARFFIGLIIAASLAVALLCYGFFQGSSDPEECYLLLVVATLGAAVLAASTHFVSFFLALEILSVALYTLIAYPHRTRNHIEAGLKYLVLAAVSAAFLLFGLGLIYAVTGTMNFAGACSPSQRTWLAPQVLFAGWGLVLVGIGFKLALVPFHLWTPDVYEGAPAPIAAFVATDI